MVVTPARILIAEFGVSATGYGLSPSLAVNTMYLTDAKKYTFDMLTMSSYLKNEIMDEEITQDNITAYLTRLGTKFTSNLTT